MHAVELTHFAVTPIVNFSQSVPLDAKVPAARDEDVYARRPKVAERFYASPRRRDDSVQEFDSPFVFAPSSSPHSHAQIGVFHDAEASVETADVFEIIPSHEHGLVAE